MAEKLLTQILEAHVVLLGCYEEGKMYKKMSYIFSPLLIKFHKECNILYTVWKRTMHIQNNDTPVTHVHTHIHTHVHACSKYLI